MDRQRAREIIRDVQANYVRFFYDHSEIKTWINESTNPAAVVAALPLCLAKPDNNFERRSVVIFIFHVALQQMPNFRRVNLAERIKAVRQSRG